MIKAGIVGGAGYTGIELLRLLASHPEVELCAITSRSEAGKRVDEIFPSLRGRVDLQFTKPDESSLSGCNVVFFATPNAVAMRGAPALLDEGVRIIDLSADFRLKDIAAWEKWYGVQHASAELVPDAVYGLPEVYRENIREAKLIANPGCYPTAILLGFLPLVEAGAVALDYLIANAVSGVSGAGRKAEFNLLYAEAADNFKAYGVSGHRHLLEITQTLVDVTKEPAALTFVPHLAPIIRGIHATLYARLTSPIDIQKLYMERYRNEPFVDVLPFASHPETRSVRGANICRISLHRPSPSSVVVLSVIDNLVKGAAGQAVQNMNIMFGMPETLGLEISPIVP
ncbi:MAG: N-acetyl-gamma-glutamyl-phosphate reductase [Burkholderiales bacterium]